MTRTKLTLTLGLCLRLHGQIVTIPNTTFPATRAAINSNFASAVDKTANYVNPAWINSLAWSKITGVPSFIGLFSDGGSNVVLSGRGLTLSNNTGIAINNTSGTAIQVLNYNASNVTTLGGNQELKLHGTTEITSSNTAPILYTSGTSDGVTLGAHRFDTLIAFVTPGTKLVAWRNFGTEKASILYDGSILGTGLTAFGAAGGIVTPAIGNSAPNLEIAGPVRSSRPSVQTQYVELVSDLIGHSIGLHSYGANKTLNFINESSSITANMGFNFYSGLTASMAYIGGFDSNNNWTVVNSSLFEGPVAAASLNYIATDTGSGGNVIAGTLSGITLAAGLQVTIKLAHVVTGAATFNLNGSGNIAIKSHFSPSSNVANAYVAGSLLTVIYDGTVWQDISQ